MACYGVRSDSGVHLLKLVVFGSQTQTEIIVNLRPSIVVLFKLIHNDNLAKF